MERSGLILRIIPYSDNGKIIKCLTEENGLQAYFIRGSKKSRNAGYIQTGKYIAFTLNERPSKMPVIKDCQPDGDLGNASLRAEAYGVWLFTLELLNKTLEDNFSIPGLRKTIDLYFTHLSHGTISYSPLTPSILIARTFGIWDLNTPISGHETNTISDLKQLGYSPTVAQSNEEDLFGTLLNRFKAHYSFSKLDSLELLS